MHYSGSSRRSWPTECSTNSLVNWPGATDADVATFLKGHPNCTAVLAKAASVNISNNELTCLPAVGGSYAAWGKARAMDLSDNKITALAEDIVKQCAGTYISGGSLFFGMMHYMYM